MIKYGGLGVADPDPNPDPFLGLRDPDPLVRDTDPDTAPDPALDPDPSVLSSSKNSKIDSYCRSVPKIYGSATLGGIKVPGLFSWVIISRHGILYLDDEAKAARLTAMSSLMVRLAA